MARRLNTYVHLHVNGVSRAYGPEDAVPADVAKLITNSAVWEDHTAEEDELSGSAAAATDVPIPPKGGKGSGLSEWQKYATFHGFGFDADASREEIIEALEAADVPTE